MTTKARGFFAGAFEAFVAAREAQGARYANAALLGLDDATLKSLGYTREELKKRASAYLI